MKNPYPKAYAGEIIGAFEYLTPLWLVRAIDAVKMRGGQDDAMYIVAADYRVRYRFAGTTAWKTITVPAGMLTDLASVPQIAQSLIGRVGPHLEASIVHDFLYIAWQDIPNRLARPADWDFADEVFRAGMVEAKVDPVQAALIHLAVRKAGWPVYAASNLPPRYIDVPKFPPPSVPLERP